MADPASSSGLLRLRRAIWRTTAFRLAGFYMAVFFVVIGLGLGYVYWATVAVIEAEGRAAIDREIETLGRQYQRGGLSRLIVLIEDRSVPGVRTDSVYLLVTPEFQPVAGNLNSWPPGAAQADVVHFPILKRDGEEQVPREVTARTLRLPGGYRLLVGRDSEQAGQYRENFLNAVTLVALSTIAIGIATGIYASRRILRRVDRAAVAGEAIAGGNLDSRLPVSGSGDEFDRLAISLNKTLDRIEDLMGGMRIATDSISHDVRRPLTRLRAKLDLALRENAADTGLDAMETALVEIDKTVQILDNLLKIARAEAGVAGSGLIKGDLAALAEEAIELYEVLAEEKEITIHANLGAASTQIEPQLMAQAVGNLFDNAIKYTGYGGRIAVRTGNGPDGIWIEIEDNGPGIAAADRKRATDRFVRLDDDGSRATEGSGLGLSLVRAVAHLHDGALVLDDAEPGLRVRITLPGS